MGLDNLDSDSDGQIGSQAETFLLIIYATTAVARSLGRGVISGQTKLHLSVLVEPRWEPQMMDSFQLEPLLESGAAGTTIVTAFEKCCCNCEYHCLSLEPPPSLLLLYLRSVAVFECHLLEFHCGPFL